MQLNNGLKPTDDATIESNTLLPSERSAAGNNAGQFTGKQTLYTPIKEALYMHIHCTSQRLAGEENRRISSTPTRVIGGAE